MYVLRENNMENVADKVRATVESWPSYNKEHHNECFATSEHSTKLPIEKPVFTKRTGADTKFSNCLDCTKLSVCKYKDDYQRDFIKICEIAEYINVPIVISAICQEFHAKTSSFTIGNRGSNGFSYPDDGTVYGNHD